MATPQRLERAAGGVARGFLVSMLLVLGACAADKGTIGAVLSQRADGTLVIHEAPSGLAAAQGGLKPGDELLLIDGRDVRAMSSAQVHSALSGDVGDPVKLTVVRGDDIVRVTLRRTKAPPSLRGAVRARDAE
jgi:C-terminal processing protease CtpA/Prc